jgi:hypothetical protein
MSSTLVAYFPMRFPHSSAYFLDQRMHTRILSFLVTLLIVGASDVDNTTVPTRLIPVTVAKQPPQFTTLSYIGGVFIMLLFVLLPVGLMAYRNRNSIVEFIKNR